ncbi:protein adenylyltransferase SelO [Sagittula sp. SSi028]|uniref:protein adenylyltransferase SelO n=1 Tax=Sagittula sp. SSi028 TaxID=3400636 RepID=UPI003AF59935
MTLHIPFDNSFARLDGPLFARLDPTPVSNPGLIAFNHALAEDLGISGTDDAHTLAQALSGNHPPEGAEPLAQVYAGHQFGGFSPQLGDGRAHLLGEVVTPQGRFDIQLKGSGPTPFSRRGDGRAWLGPVLREYLVSEAMHALGVPTSRALAAVRSGDEVIRERPLPGAVLTRVASSHIRVGTFQYFAARRETDTLRTLFDYTRDRHAPNADGPEALLAATIQKQAALVTQWMGLGFIHGVMNTDNCTLSGETIDYGPCAFMDAYDPRRVFSSIDRQGRYAFAAQADIIVWNMAQLASALVPLMTDEEAAVTRFQSMIEEMPDLLRHEWLTRFAAKLGIDAPRDEDGPLIGELLSLMHKGGSDFTNTFAALTDGSARDEIADRAAYDDWHARWQKRLEAEPDAQDVMAAANPRVIPRNHQIEAVIAAAVDGDDAPFHRLHAALAQPYDARADNHWLRAAPAPDERVQATFCGT